MVISNQCGSGRTAPRLLPAATDVPPLRPPPLRSPAGLTSPANGVDATRSAQGMLLLPYFSQRTLRSAMHSRRFQSTFYVDCVCAAT